MRLAVEEKGLANNGLQTVGFEGFGYEKGGFRRRPRQKAFRIGGDKNHRHGKRFKNLIDRFESRASVGKLNIREDEAWPFAPDSVDRLAMGPRDIGDAVALFLDEVLKIERDEGLVLDDQDIGANLVGDLLASGINEVCRLLDRAVERARDFRGIEALERTEKKCNSRTQGNRFEVTMRAGFIAGERSWIDVVIDWHCPPDFEEQAVKRRPWIGALRKLGRIRDDGL